MNQQVDIERYLEEFRSEIGQLNKSVKDLSDDNARLNRRVEALNVENSSLKKKNADLRKRLSKYEDAQPPKNSGNSSVPEFFGGVGSSYFDSRSRRSLFSDLSDFISTF